jgi:hypothetical protein
LGSKDIDVVFASDKAKHQSLFAYFMTHGFQERRRSLFDKEFVKEISVADKKIEIIVDAVSSSRTILFEKRKARIPWSWSMKYNVEQKIANATILIPIAELLFVYKLGAILGRNDIMKTGLDFHYYRSKVWKDVYDSLSLLEYLKNNDIVLKFLEESKLALYSEEIMQIINDNYDSQMQGILPNIDLNKFKKFMF